MSGQSTYLFYVKKCGVCCTLDDFLMAGEIKAPPEKFPSVHKKISILYDELSELLQKGEDIYDNYVTNTACLFLKNKLFYIPN